MVNSPINTSGSELEKMAFFDEVGCVLYISKSSAFNASVRSFATQLKRAHGEVLKQESVSMEEIQNLHTNHRAVRFTGKDVDSSEMQKAAVMMFKSAVDKRASDIHIRVSFKGHAQVLFRIHNDLVSQDQQTPEWGRRMCSTIYQSMSDISDPTYDEKARQDGRISAKDKLGTQLDGIRIATTPQVDGMVMVLRLLYNDAKKSTDITELGYEKSQRDQVDLMKRRPTGINIIAGPTGSGKSTTLQRVLMSVHAECGGKKHIITVEDPPEYPMPGIVQTPVANADTEAERSAAFQAAIKATMRLDPNVMMIGEMRDSPSARLAIQAAMTGHQVWSTLHANDAFGIIDRMVDLGVPLSMMTDPSIVTGMICQRLLKVLCPHCKKPFASLRRGDPEQDRIMSVVGLDITHAFVTGPGCSQCRQTGIQGRTCASEIVVPDHGLMKLLRIGDREAAIQYWRDRGGRSVRSIAIEKINNGHVDPFQAEEEVGPLNAVDGHVPELATGEIQ